MEEWAHIFKERKAQPLGPVISGQSPPPSDSSLNTDYCEEEAERLLEHRFLKLKHKAIYINMEHEEVAPIFKAAKSSFVSEMFNFCHQQGLRAPFESVPPPATSPEDSTITPETKELYREIALCTHPDRLQGLSEGEIEERVALYHEASAGKASGDFSKLLNVALQLDIDIKKLSHDYLDEMEVAIHDLEAKIQKIKSDIMWKWYYASPENQHSIFSQLTQKCPPREE